MPLRCVRRVTSWIRIGASRLARSFLCTHRKLISVTRLVLRARGNVGRGWGQLRRRRVHTEMTRKSEGEGTHALRMRRSMGTPEMKPTSLPVSATRMPTCQSGTYPGGLRALRTPNKESQVPLETRGRERRGDAPLDELGRVVEAERGVEVLDVVVREQVVHLLLLRALSPRRSALGPHPVERLGAKRERGRRERDAPAPRQSGRP